jgi:hypothetical protein
MVKGLRSEAMAITKNEAVKVLDWPTGIAPFSAIEKKNGIKHLPYMIGFSEISDMTKISRSKKILDVA